MFKTISVLLKEKTHMKVSKPHYDSIGLKSAELAEDKLKGRPGGTYII